MSPRRGFNLRTFHHLATHWQVIVRHRELEDGDGIDDTICVRDVQVGTARVEGSRSRSVAADRYRCILGYGTHDGERFTCRRQGLGAAVAYAADAAVPM